MIIIHMIIMWMPCASHVVFTHETSEGIFDSQVYVWKGSHNVHLKNESVYYHIMKVEYMV